MTAAERSSTAGEALEDAVDQVIADHGGTRQALAALVVEVGDLKQELAKTSMAVSFGYSRGWHRKKVQN